MEIGRGFTAIYNFNLNQQSYQINLTSSISNEPAIKQLLRQCEAKQVLSVDDLEKRLKCLGDLKINYIKVCSVSLPILTGESKTISLPNKTLAEIAKSLTPNLQACCPKGAGSMVMLSKPSEGAIQINTGLQCIEGERVDGQTAALIGSGAKMFTALCTMALISQGAINKKTNPPKPLTLETKASEVFSEQQMKIFNDKAKAEALTLGMLLSHTSGLVYFADDNRADRPGQSLSNILDSKAAGSVKFYGYPGDQIYSYSNHIGLAAAMLEIACEKPYTQILQEVLLLPLGMDRTSYTCPKDEHVLLAYQTSPHHPEAPAESQRKEIMDPMMQGAGGLWSCMDDMEKLGIALGSALSKKSELLSKSGKVLINKENLQNMVQPHSVNAPTGLAFDLEGDVIGKGGGIHGYDFKFKVDVKTGCCVSMMCNYANKAGFEEYLKTTADALKALNPSISLPQTPKRNFIPNEVQELSIEDCSQYFKGFAGILAFSNDSPLTRINFNGLTLPVSQLPISPTGESERYLITGNSPFHGKELLIYQRNGRRYPCISDSSTGVEVWSFGEVLDLKLPIISSSDLFNQFQSASGNYVSSNPEGPMVKISIDRQKGLTLASQDSPPSKCLITSLSPGEVSFVTCLNNGPQDLSFKLSKLPNSDTWILAVLMAETESFVEYLSKK